MAIHLPEHPPGRTFKARQLLRITEVFGELSQWEVTARVPSEPTREKSNQAGQLRQAGSWQEETEQFPWPVAWVDWVMSIETQVWPNPGQPHFFRKPDSFKE